MRLGVGIGWRPPIELTIERMTPAPDFVEVIAENILPKRPPTSLQLLRRRGVSVIPHGIGLGLAGADRPDRRRLRHLAACAEAFDSPLVSDHIAFVRAGGVEAGHLLPAPRTKETLEICVENISLAQAALPVPLVLENIAVLTGWPEDDLSEGEFLSELVARTGVGLLIDVANLHTNRVNQRSDPTAVLNSLPPNALGYVHVAGGHDHDGLWHDTHRDAPTEEIYDVLDRLCARVTPPGVMLEWDGDYPTDKVLSQVLERIGEIARRHAHEQPDSTDSPRAPRMATAPSVTAAARERLDARQATLLRFLLDEHTPEADALPPALDGFDLERLRIQALSLAAKRRRTATAHAAPDWAGH